MRALIDLATADPRVGLAIDEVLLDDVRAGRMGSIRFWINGRAVVVGRSQSVADEVDVAVAEQAKIPILRRISGGGTVYHYPGNLNLSVILSKRQGVSSVADVFRVCGEAVAAGLAPWGDVACNENALRVLDRKIGGAAQARRGDAVLYHTTLLLAPDEIPLTQLLLANRSGYAPKRLASRPWETITLAEVSDSPADVSDIIDRLGRTLEERLGFRSRPGGLTSAELQRVQELVLTKYGRDSWNRSH